MPRPLLYTLSLCLTLSACGAPRGPEAVSTEVTHEVGVSQSRLVGGTSTNLRPEVGQFSKPGSSCTATLIHPRYALTAAHCVDSTNYDNVAVRPGMLFRTTGHISSVDRIHSFAYRRYEYTSSLGRATDVALLRLRTPVPSAVATPATIAARGPNPDERVTIFGFGCTQREPQSGGGDKQYFEFDFGDDTQALCPGDSGGPVFLGDRHAGGEIWGVNADYTGTGSFEELDDVFGDVVGLKLQIEAIIRQWEGDDLEFGFDRPGGDYDGFRVYSRDVEDCRRACRGDARCRAFAYREPNSTSSYGYCWLKDRTPGMTARFGYISGAAAKVNRRMGFTGGYRTFRPSPSSPDTCAQMCSKEECNSWDYRTINRKPQCTLSRRHKSPTACPACSSGLMRPAREENVGRVGSNYLTFASQTIDACEGACARQTRCKAYSFRSTDRRCYLKDAEGAPSSMPGFTSGKKRGLEVNTDRPGGSFSAISLTYPDASACQAACANHSLCRAWTYVPPSSGSPRCYLKSRVSKAYSTSGLTSGWQFRLPGRVVWIEDPPNTDRLGDDMRTAIVTSPIACQASCKRDSSCRAWTFRPASGWVPARCYLKDGFGSARNTTNMVSGLGGLEFLR